MSGARAAARAALLIVAMVATVTIGAGPAVANSDCLALWSPGTWAPGSITGCAADLMASRPGTRPGPGPATGPALTAAFHGLPAAHNGQQLFTFELRFSQEFQGLRLTALKQALEVTGGRLVDVKRTVRGQNQSVTVRVRPSSTGAVTVRLPGKKKLWNPVSATVAGPAAAPTEPVTPVASPPATPVTPPPAAETPAPLTATFHGLPDEHNGQKLFSFEIRFSEEFRGLRLTALKQALQVTGGRVIDVRRTVRGENRRVTVRVRPSSHEPVTVALGATTDCSATGAICASDGRQLSGSLSANITSPAWGGEPVGTPIPYSLATLKSLGLPPPPPQAKTVVKTVSTGKPSGFPTSDAGTVVNMNAMGIWGEHPSLYANGSPTSKNTAVDLQLRERWDRGGHTVVKARCTQGGTETDCYAGQFPENLGMNWGNFDPTVGERYCGVHVKGECQNNPPSVDIYGRWFSYPHDAGTSDMKVHVRTVRATYGHNGKVELMRFFSRHDRGWLDYYGDFFKAEAHLEAPGTSVQPTRIGTQGQARWNGKVVAVDSSRDLWTRGQLIGGDASLFINWGGQNTSDVVNVRLNNLKASHTHGGSPLMPGTYANQAWDAVALDSSGNFSQTHSNGKVEVTFRNQVDDATDSKNADTAGGTFEIFGVMKGGFVATR